MGKKIFVALVAVFFFYMASPLIMPVAMGAILAVLFAPLVFRLEKRGMSPVISSALLTFGITTVILLPTSLLLFFAAKTAFTELQILSKASSSDQGMFDNFIGIPQIQGFMVWVTDHIPVNMTDLSQAFHEFGQSLGIKLTEVIGGVLSQLPGMGLALAIVVVSVYFFLLDGKKLVLFLRRNSFFNPEQTEQLLTAVGDMCRSVILAALVSGGLQALLEILGCAITGTSGMALIGLLVFIASFLPVVGTAPVTLGVALQQFAQGRQGAGIVLLVFALIIMGADNLVRPAFLKGSANLHPLLAFVAAFGGLQTLGFLGVFMGPIIASLFVVTVQILSKDVEVQSS